MTARRPCMRQARPFHATQRGTDRMQRPAMARSNLALHRIAASPWQPVEAELDAWAACGRIVRFWWRDDDAVAPSPALDRLLALAEGVPLTLAVIPEMAEPALAGRLAEAPQVAVVQHGVAHENHAAPDAKRVELTQAGAAPALVAASKRLAELFGEQILPVLVPPWNRIAPALVPLLPGCGFAGLSTFGPRPQRLAAPGLVQVNTHADPVNWRARRARPVAEFATGLAETLEARRRGRADADEPVGLLTHHRLGDRAIEAMVAALASLVSDHPAACWVGLGEAIA